MKRTSKTLGAIGWIAVVLGLGACGAVDEIDEGFDCHNLCERYRTCYDVNYDTDACRDRCQGYVDGIDASRADTCDACLDPMSCVDAAFNCSAECAGILGPTPQ